MWATGGDWGFACYMCKPRRYSKFVDDCVSSEQALGAKGGFATDVRCRLELCYPEL